MALEKVVNRKKTRESIESLGKKSNKKIHWHPNIQQFFKQTSNEKIISRLTEVGLKDHLVYE